MNWSRHLFIYPSSRNLQLGLHVTFLLQHELIHFLWSVLIISDPALQPYLSCSPEDSLVELLRDNVILKQRQDKSVLDPVSSSVAEILVLVKGSRIF